MPESFNYYPENQNQQESLDINKTNLSFTDLEENIKQNYETNSTIPGADNLALNQYKALQETNNSKENNETQIHKETKEELDKEAFKNEMKIFLYEKLGINNNLENNSKFENFIKGVIDGGILDNYDLLVQIYETNGKIILDGIEQLLTWEGLKKLAENLKEDLWTLWNGNAYEKGKVSAEVVLGLITAGAGITASLAKKGVKEGVKLTTKQIAKLRVNKERLVESYEVKQVIGDTKNKVDEIIPKQELDFEKAIVEDIAKLGDKDRLEAASFYLEKQLTKQEQQAILKAHNVGINRDLAGIYNYNQNEILEKTKILKEAGFTKEERRILLEKGVCGRENLEELYKNPKYNFLEKHKDILGEDITINDIVGEGTQAIIMRHPTNDSLVIKLAKEGKVDNILDEYKNHKLFYDIWRTGIKNGDLNLKARVPKVLSGEKDGYFYIERIEGQSLYSKTLIDRFENKLSLENKKNLLNLSDKQVREYLKDNFGETDSYLDMLIEDYSADYLADLLGTGYMYRKKYGKIGDTPLSNTLDYLRKKGISHNDLHPGNIMLDKNENIYIIDFGRIKLLDNK